MTLLSKKEFARLCGMTTGNISNYAVRGKVVYTGEEINDEIEPNKSFLQKRMASRPQQPDPEPETPEKKVKEKKAKPAKAPRAPVDKKPNESGEMYREDLRRKRVMNETAEIDKQLAMKKLMRLDGQFVKVDQVRGIMKQLGTSYSRQFWNLANLFIVEFGKKHSLTSVQGAEIKKFFLDGINRHIHKAAEDAKRELRKISAETAEKKGVGEHG